MASANFHFNAQASLLKIQTTAATTVNLNLDSTDGVRTALWSVYGTDETSEGEWSVNNPTSILGATLSTPASGTGKCCVVACLINGGSALTPRATAKAYIGVEVVADKEINESDAVYGWGALVNPVIRSSAVPVSSRYALTVNSIVSTPVLLSSAEDVVHAVDLTAAGGDVVVQLPDDAPTGRRFTLTSTSVSSPYRVVVSPPIGHTVVGLGELTLLAGTSLDVFYLGGTSWGALGVKHDVYERTLLGGVAGTDQTSFQSVGAVVIDSDAFVNTANVVWSALIETTEGTDAAEVRLFNVTTASAVGGSTLSSNSLNPAVVSASISLAAGVNVYEAQLRLQTTGSPNRATCRQAQIEIHWVQA